MSDKELASAGLNDTQFTLGDDGSVILTDEAIKRVSSIVPSAADRVKMSESEARAKAKARAEAAAQAAEAAKISPTAQDGPQGDPAAGAGFRIQGRAGHQGGRARIRWKRNPAAR